MKNEPTLPSSGDKPPADVAVFMPNYNHARFLPHSLDALLGQTLRPKGIWIVDDASKDNSAEILTDYQRRYPDLIHVTLLERNRGYLANMLDWMKTVDSKYVYICAADDVPMPRLFEENIALLERFPEAALSSAMSRLMNAEGDDLGSFPTARVLDAPGYLPPGAVAEQLMRDDAWFMGNVVLYRREPFCAQGFDAQLGSFADGLLYRVLSLRHGACFVPRELGYWRRMEGGEASQTAGSPAEILRIADRMVALVEGPYAELFPKGYARRWRGRWIFWGLLACLSLPQAAARAKLDLLLRGEPAAKRALLSLSIRAPIAHRSLTKLLGFVLLRQRDALPALGRLFATRQGRPRA